MDKSWLLMQIVLLSLPGEVLVVLDLRPDESLLEAGFAREVSSSQLLPLWYCLIVLSCMVGVQSWNLS